MRIDDFAEVQEALWEARLKWYNIGVRLELVVSDLDCIDAEVGIGLEDKFNRMIQKRLRQRKACTWRELYDVLRHPTVGMPGVAAELKKQKLICEYNKPLVDVNIHVYFFPASVTSPDTPTAINKDIRGEISMLK